MPEQDPTSTSAPPAAEEALLPERSSLLRKIVMLAVVLVVVAVECMVAYFYIPTAAETTALAQATLENTQDPEALPGALELPADEPLANQIEVDLGQYSVTSTQPMTNTALRIDFQLWGAVDEEDYDEFMDRLEAKRHRFREQVMVTVRSANIADYSDPHLGLIKRTILQKTNALLGKPYLRAVMLDDFSFIEQ